MKNKSPKPPILAAAPERRVRYVGTEERQKRMEAIESMMIANLGSSTIYAEMRKPPFDMKKSAVDRYMSTIRDQWQDEEREKRPHNKQQAMRRITGHIIRAREKGNFAAVAQFERLLAEMQGTLVPTEHVIHVNGRESEAMTAVLAGLTEERRRELIAKAETAGLLTVQAESVTVDEKPTEKPETTAPSTKP